MQFFKNGPDIPERLLQGHEEGEVVFFCGAGISYPAGLPGFRELVEKLYARLAPVRDAEQQAAIDAKQFDTAIALLENKHVGGRKQVRKTLNKLLRPKATDPEATATHEALLRLSETREDQRRLVTTNFDRLFQKVTRRDGLRVPTFQAPLLPVPKTRWNGLVYLHGLLAGKPDEDNLNSLVVSSGDFGLAYLTEGWAARFATEMFRNFTVCFVGYSAEDPVLRYILDAFAADRRLGETPHEVFAFGHHSEDDRATQANKWRAKNVTPILYLKDKPHSHLHRTLQEWAKTYGDGVSGKEQIVSQGAITPPVRSTREDNFVGRVLWALSDRSGLPAKHFAEMDPVPSLEWLKPLSEAHFGPDRLTAFGVEPEGAVDKKFRFSLTRRPALYPLAPDMALVDSGPQWTRWDDVMAHLANAGCCGISTIPTWYCGSWNVAHSCTNRSRARSQAASRSWTGSRTKGKTAELDHIEASAPNAIPSPLMRTLWHLLLTGRVQWRGLGLALHDWRKRFRRNGLTTTLRLDLREILTPRVSLSKPFPRLVENDEEREPQRMRDIVESEVVMSAKYVHSVSGEICPRMNVGAQRCRSCCRTSADSCSMPSNLMRELGKADDKSDRSYIVQPSIAAHPQNRQFHDWTALIDLTRDAWLAAAAQSPDRARLVAEGWFHVPYPLFRRLTFFAATQTESHPMPAGTEVAACRRVLVALVGRNDPRGDSPADRAQSGTGRGWTPRTQIRSPEGASSRDVQEGHRRTSLWTRIREREIWLRLARTGEKQLPKLSPRQDERLSELSGKYGAWKLAEDEQDEFPFWMSDVGEVRPSLTSPREPAELVGWLKENRTSESWEADDWREHCREDLPTTAGSAEDTGRTRRMACAIVGVQPCTRGLRKI